MKKLILIVGLCWGAPAWAQNNANFEFVGPVQQQPSSRENFNAVVLRIQAMSPRSAAKVVAAMSTEMAAEIVSALEPNKAAKLLQNMPANQAAQILQTLVKPAPEPVVEIRSEEVVAPPLPPTQETQDANP
ncbi:MAG: hypothetical protein R3E66_18065 [bacterium]